MSNPYHDIFDKADQYGIKYVAGTRHYYIEKEMDIDDEGNPYDILGEIGECFIDTLEYWIGINSANGFHEINYIPSGVTIRREWSKAKLNKRSATLEVSIANVLQNKYMHIELTDPSSDSFYRGEDIKRYNRLLVLIENFIDQSIEKTTHGEYYYVDEQ